MNLIGEDEVINFIWYQGYDHKSRRKKYKIDHISKAKNRTKKSNKFKV